jgi:hypothetical protein
MAGVPGVAPYGLNSRRFRRSMPLPADADGRPRLPGRLRPRLPPSPCVIEPYTLPADSLASAGHVGGPGMWVQSDAEQGAPCRPRWLPSPAPIHVPREPRRQVLVDEGPLVLVETRKDLSQMKLPFEVQQAHRPDPPLTHAAAASARRRVWPREAAESRRAGRHAFVCGLYLALATLGVLAVAASSGA